MGASNLFVNAVKSYQHLIPNLFIRGVQPLPNPDPHSRSHRVLTVGKLIDSLDPLLPKSMLLGQCLDGLPFIMRLDNPEIGAILIGCDPGCGKTHQLQVMVDSALMVNAPHDLQVSILTHHPNEWEALKRDARKKKYLHGLHAWYDTGAERIIKELTKLAETRRGAGQQGAAVLFILDDFNFVEDLSYEAQVNLHWLLAYGSQSGVWVIGGLKADYALGFRYWLEKFHTRIIGRTLSVENAEILATRPDSQACLCSSGEFRVWTANTWLTYRLPLLGD